MPVIQRADAPGFSQLPQSIDRKCEIGVLLDAGVIKRLAAVGVDQRRDVDVYGNFSDTGVTTANSFIERFLIRCNKPGARYQYQATVSQWFFERYPRDRVDAAPADRFSKTVDT